MDKKDIITFKADKELAKLLKNIENRSEFIRNAVLSAFENACPMCHGSGVIGAHQKKHWNTFLKKHRQKSCSECHGAIYICK